MDWGEFFVCHGWRCIIIIIIIIVDEFFPPAFADSFSLKTKCQQVFSGLQDAS